MTKLYEYKEDSPVADFQNDNTKGIFSLNAQRSMWVMRCDKRAGNLQNYASILLRYISMDLQYTYCT